MFDGVTQKLLADALASVCRVDEEHFNLAGSHAGEAGDALMGILAADQHDRIQVLVLHHVT
ncbi:hypothetical protein D3C86_2236920 [compost metagenome]